MRRFRSLAVTVCVCVSSGCAVYTGSARELAPRVLEQERGWIAVKGVRPVKQQADHDCGPAALRMVLDYWRRPVPEHLTSASPDTRVSAAELRDQARRAGLLSFVVEGRVNDLAFELKHHRPVIVGLAKPTAGNGAVAHYEVVVGIHPATRRIATLDPASGWRQNSFEGFLREWLATGSVLLVFMPG